MSRLNPTSLAGTPLLPNHAVHFFWQALYPLHVSGSTPEEAYLVRLRLCRTRLFWEPCENHWIWHVVSSIRVQGPDGGL